MQDKHDGGNKSKHEYIFSSMTTYRKIAIPLFWETIPHGGTSCVDICIRLLSHVQTVFGSERVASLTADREFIGQVSTAN